MAGATKPPPPLTSSPYPFAAAPDIIRAHQKDAYFQGVLTNQLTDLHRRLRGARSAHAWAAEARTAADLLYLCLTTLPGNRTLGEEYCDLVQVEAPPKYSRPSAATNSKPSGSGSSSGGGGNSNNSNCSSTNGSSVSAKESEAHTLVVADRIGTDGLSGPLLPSLGRRAALVVCTVLGPYAAALVLPRVRAALRKRLQSRLAELARQRNPNSAASGGKDARGGDDGLRRHSASYRLQRYLLAHLGELTSGEHLRALTLAVFYFTGAYYSLTKRILGLRYVFTRRVGEDSVEGGGGGGGDRVGYEVLGVLLVVQMLVRGYLHVRATLAGGAPAEREEEVAIRERAGYGYGVDVSPYDSAISSNNELLSAGAGMSASGQRSPAEIAASTHTPLPKGGGPRYDLRAESVMGWIKGRQQRKCTLCLEELKDPAATQCGHVFCWSCIGDWVREKPECPLCRREAMVQHILPLRAG